MSTNEGSGKGRRWLRIIAVVVGVLVLLVILAPSLVSWTIGRGIVASAVGSAVNGTVSVNGVRFGWSAPQRIQGLQIDDRVGGSAIRADVEVNRSLFSLITDAMGTLEVTARADVTTTRGADGTLGLAKLMKPSPTPSAPSSPLPRSLVVSVKLDPSSIAIDQGADGKMALTDFTGTLRFAAADGSIKADLKGRLGSGAASGAAGAAAGPLAVVADLRQVLNANGDPTIGAALGTAKITAGPVALRYEGATSSLQAMELMLDATDAAKPMTLAFSVTGAQREAIDISDLAGRASLGRDPKGPLGLSASQINASIDRGAIAVRSGDEPFSATGIKADVAVGAGGRATFTVAAETAIGSRRGSVKGEGALDHLFDDAFKLTLAQTTGSAQVSVERAVVPAGPLLAEIESFTATLVAQNIAEPIRVTVNGKGTVSEAAPQPGTTAATGGATASAPNRAAPSQPSSITANAALTRDAKSAIGISTDPRSFSGTLEAKGIPSAVLRPFIPMIGELRIDPVRDIGPIVNVNASATAGAAAPITFSMRAARMNIDITAVVDPESGSVRDGSGRITATIAPELLAKTPIKSVASLSTIITINKLSMPRKGGALLLDDAAGELGVEIDGPFTVAIGTMAPPSFARVNVTAQTQRFADGAATTVAFVVDGVPTQLTANLTGLKGLDAPNFDFNAINAKGTLALGLINWSQPPTILKESAPMLRDFGLTQSTVGLGFDGGMKSGAALLKITDGTQVVTSSLSWNAERARAEAIAVTTTLTNTTLDALGLKDFRLAQPAPLQVTIEPLEMARKDLESGRIELPPLTIGVRAPAITFAQAPGLKQPLALRSLDTTVALRLAPDIAANVKGTVAVSEGSSAPTNPISLMAFTFDGTRLKESDRQWSATVDSKDLEATRLLTLAGIDHTKVPGIAVGDRGTLALKVGTEAAGSLGVQFDSAIGATRGSGKAVLMKDGAVGVPTADLSITLDGTKSSAFFGEEKDPSGTRLITRASALPVTVSLRDVLIPAPSADGTRALARSKATATLTTGNLDLELTRVGATRIGAVDGRLAMLGDGKSLDLRATSTLTTPQNGTQPLALRVTMTDFADASGALDWVRMTLTGQARMQGLPMALVDVFADGDAVMVEAFGPQLNADVNAVSPSGSSGSVLSGTVKSEFLTIDLGRVAIENQMITIQQSAPLTAALIPNPTLRERVLKPINPIFADIRPQQGRPINFAIDALSLPTSIALTDLNAHFTVTVGDVELQRSGAILSLMQLVREDDDGIIPGNISPLDGTITDGRLSYDNFTISMGRIGNTWNQQIYSSGDVDLASKPMYATAIAVDYPIAGIGRLAAGATRFDAFFGRINQVISNIPLMDTNAIRMRATFSGPIEPGRELNMAFEPVLVTPPGSNPINQVLDGIFGDKGILRLPGSGGQQSGGGSSGSGGGNSGGTQGSGGSTGGGTGGSTQPPAKPRDPIRGIIDDIFKPKK